MEYVSLLTRMKRVEAAIVSKLSGVDTYGVPADERNMISSIRDGLVDARLDIRDYELSQTRAEQLEHARAVKERLEDVNKLIIAASAYNIFSAVDVAQLSAQIEQITDGLE